ncbi:CHAT domain-containing protein [Kordia sp. YSTF-M3]|uniref:CHAT domain-containing protein n=1 Tax=Kordia aestuariivivens TaxID=2759037 RepID=A0ABR7Q6I4_9FLAO|nr:CHAT domain-containing protein [Kordia aestuariivivens]MBC8754058.1 CHAT domain-containing protein [Kordia aestuariivivens]
MRFSLIVLLFFIETFTCFSQNSNTYYEKAKEQYNAEQYEQSLENFQLAKQQFLNQQNALDVVICLSYISKIKSIQSDYNSSLDYSIEALSYLKHGEINNDSMYADLMSGKALSLKFLGQFQQAYVITDSLINHLKAKKETEKYLANAYQIKSRVEIDLGRHDSSIISAKKALSYTNDQNQEQKAALLNIIGVGFYLKDQLDSALYYYNASYKIKQAIDADNYQLAIAKYNIGIVYEDLGDYDKAIEFYNKAAKYDLSDRGEEIGFLSDIYVALTNTYFSKNDLEKAEEYAEKALQIAIRRYGENSPNTSFAYIAYSNIFELKGDYKKSIEYVKKALEIRRNTYGANHRWTAESLLSISENQVELKRFTEAEKNYNEVITIAKSINNKLVQAYAEIGLGTIYIETNQHDLAIAALKAAKGKFITTYGNYHETHLRVLVLEAENYFKKGAPETALQIIEVIKANAKNSNLFYGLDALTLELNIALHDYNESGDLKLLEKNIQNIDDAIQLIFKIKKDYPSSKSRIYVNNSMNYFVAKAIEASYILYNSTHDFMYVEKAFELSELNRSSALVAGVQDVRFKKMANVPQALLLKENKLNHELARLKKEIYYEENAEETDREYVDELLSKQLICRTALDSLFTKIEIEHPKYYQLKYSEKGIGIKELQNNILKDDETVIEYFLGENQVYVFTISKSEINFIELPKAQNILSVLQVFRERLNKREDLTQQSKTLYKLLVKDLNVDTKRLIIIPDKELNHLPFEALIKDDAFLVENYIICYSGSASLLKTQQDHFFDFKFTRNWVGFAPEFKTNNALTSSKIEIEAVAKLMRGDTFLGEQATVESFIKSTQNSSILHLATHAEIDKVNPLYSKLIFAQDSVLTASDIYTLPINAELAVLSACETGFGKLEKSEGVMSMSRAFQYAGVRSTVMSLWKVPDKETSQIMVSFYTYLKSGTPKNKALQLAKLEYLNTVEDSFLKHPFYWAGFVLSGDISPIETGTNYWWLLFIVIPLFLIILRKQLIKIFD